ncbi:hypothetical protein OHB15_49670 [Streptosporangium subroseum]|nr:hypothetical protein OHB15_49670 [Streptosporangium subroseum]
MKSISVSNVVSGRQAATGTRPGSSSSRPSKKWAIPAWLRGLTEPVAVLLYSSDLPVGLTADLAGVSVGDDQAAPGRHALAELRHDRRRALVVGHKMQDREHQHGNGLREVQMCPDHGILTLHLM